MTVINGLVHGPLKNEQEFKQAVMKAWRKRYLKHTSFEIENEEKEPGMPDVLTLIPDFPSVFTEFKYAGKNGVIEFQKAQPLFYRQHRDLFIQILAWDSRAGGRVVYIDPDEIVKAKALRILLPETIDTEVDCNLEEKTV
jgi:hypothetical protein